MLYYGVVSDLLGEPLELFAAEEEAEAVVQACDCEPDQAGALRCRARPIPDWRFEIAVFRTWILQANPKLYDVDAALSTRQVIYCRIPQYTEELKARDRALIWRAGKEAGFIGWGVFRTDPQRYDLSREDDVLTDRRESQRAGWGRESHRR